MSNELEQTHFVAGKCFVFQVPKLESSEGFKSAHHSLSTRSAAHNTAAAERC